MRTRRSLSVLLLSVSCVSGLAVRAAASPVGYFQTNLASDVSNIGAAFTDPHLRNPWGMSFGLNTPFWVSDQVLTVATLYNGLGVPQPLVVTTPPVAPPPTGATGQVFLGGLGFTMINGAGTATFAFATLGGTIDAWNGGTVAVVQATTPGGVYTGLAQLGNMLYAANTSQGRIDVFDNTFSPTTVTGSFVAPNVPAGFTPYNIQNINGQLYVTYAMRNQSGGLVAIFDGNGNFIREFSDSHLESPWGLTVAPVGFGQFGGDLLVGNELDGRINAFNATTGVFLGTLADSNGVAIANPGLWALDFRSPQSSFDPNALFFTAGIDGEFDGVFGEIQVTSVPEPATLSLVAAASAVFGWKRAQRVAKARH